MSYSLDQRTGDILVLPDHHDIATILEAGGGQVRIVTKADHTVSATHDKWFGLKAYRIAQADSHHFSKFAKPQEIKVLKVEPEPVAEPTAEPVAE